MMSLQNKLEKVANALSAVSNKCYHYFAPSKVKAPYIVWYEDAEAGSLEADNHKAEQGIGGYVDYFTKTEFDSTIDSIQEALNSVSGLSWNLEATQYGDPQYDDDDLIHYTWYWRVR